jgi:hypothetical protein
MKPLLQSITERVDVLARESEFTSEMTAHGLTLLEAQSICAYTCDARNFGRTREDSPFFMCGISVSSCVGVLFTLEMVNT